MEGQGRSCKVIKGDGSSGKVMEGHSFPDPRLPLHVSGWEMLCRFISPISSLFPLSLLILDLRL